MPLSRRRLAQLILPLLLGVLLLHANAAVATQIVDIDATLNAINNPVQITLGPGQYLVTPIDVAGGGAFTAWNAWGNVTGCDLDGTGCTTGWLNHYLYFSASIPSTLVGTTAGPGNAVSTAALAFANAVSETFTLNQQETVSFRISDSPDQLFNNLGGVSLSITQIPEPATGAMVLLGLLWLAAARRDMWRGTR